MTRERRLGRGLEALLGRSPEGGGPPVADLDPYDGGAEHLQPGSASWEEALPVPSAEPPAEAEPTAEAQTEGHATPQPAAAIEPGGARGVQQLGVGQIDSNPSQPRQDFDPAEMQSLAESITAHGLLQPVVVRRVEDRYQLIAGERRLRAAREAGWADVPANVVEADERQTAELAIVENLQRKDLNPLEKAAAFARYLEIYACTQEDLAARLRMDRSTVANLIRLLELPQPVQEAIRQGKITQGHARALLPLGEEHEQIEFSRRIQREGLSVRQTETLVQETIDAADTGSLRVISPDGKRPGHPRPQSEHLAALEQELRAALGLKVTISHNARGRGKLVVHFRSHEEFERLRRHITGVHAPDAQIRVG